MKFEEENMKMNWKELFELGFKESKKSIEERYTLEKDGSGDPNRVAVREISERMPFPIKVLELEIDSEKYDHIKDKICPMCYYDISKYNSNEIKNLGRISPTDNKFVEILKKEFKINKAEEFIKEFNNDMRHTGQWNSDLTENMQFFFYDPRKNIEEFKWDFIQFMETPIVSVLASNLKIKPDYNSKYNLASDQIFTEKELLSKYSSSRFSSTIEDNQEDMSKMQLVPQVNEHVKKTIKRSKKLYVFGSYVYDFFIVAQHYSVMALEAAMKHRYFAHFSDTVQIKNKHESVIIENADYSRVMDHCNHHDGWDFHRITVNDEEFLSSPNKIINWLVKNKIITLYDKRKCKYRMESRNYLSHPTYAPTHLPANAYRSIEESVFLINKMFSSIKNQ